MKTYIYPALAVTIISLLSGFLLSLVNDLTKKEIADLIEITVQNSLKEVLPKATVKTDMIKNPESQIPGEENVFNIKDKNVTIKAWQGLTEAGEITGRAYQSYAQGYGDKIVIMLGVTADGAITTYKILDKKGETPGLGSKIADEPFITQWTNLKLGPELKLDVNGGKIKPITGATISSSAVLDAIENALKLDEKLRRDVIEIGLKNQQTKPEK